MLQRDQGLLRAKTLISVAAGTLPVFALAGCLGDSSGTSTLVNTKPKPPINALDVDPADGSILISTNKALFRVAKGSSRAERVKAEVSTTKGKSPLGKFLIVAATGPRRLLGSGHPNDAHEVPGLLGLIRSTDGGRHWSSVSRLGFADLHIIRPAGKLLYAYDAVLGGMLVSADGGKNWDERSTPPELMIDFVVDPDDPDHLVATDKTTVYRSLDQSKSWRPLSKAQQGRLTWPASGSLYRADGNGLVYKSSDGESWDRVGAVDGEPFKLKGLGADHLLAALSDATVLETTDGARSWKELLSP